MLAIFCAALNGYAQVKPSPQPQIVGGNNTNISAVPWQVYLEVTSNGSTFVCGGSILSSTWIATACHCVRINGAGAVGPNQVTVFAGITNITTERNSAQRPTVAAVIPHPSYGATANARNDNDIALLRLSTPLTFNANVQSIPYATNGNLTNPGTNALVSGWVGWSCLAGRWLRDSFGIILVIRFLKLQGADIAQRRVSPTAVVI